MDTAKIDTIPGEVSGSNPTVSVGAPTVGWVTYGSQDTDIYQLDLEGGQAYVLTAEKIGNWWLPGFSVLNPAGSIERAEVIHFTKTEPGFYDSNSDYFLLYEVDTTLYFRIQGQFRTTAQYTFRLSEVAVTPHTDLDDFLQWDNEHDVYDGGAGQDTLSFAHFVNPIVVELYYGVVKGTDIVTPSSRVNLRNVEVIEGTKGNDSLIGDYFRPGYDGAYDVVHGALLNEVTWRGLDGDDTLGTTSGITVFDGGSGNDTADYSGAGRSDGAVGVSVSLLDCAGQSGDAAGDRLISIENITGSAGSDRLTGDHNANRLVGGDGFDTLVGLGGDDVLDGGFSHPYLKSVVELSRAVFSFDRSEYAITASVDDDGIISAIVEHVGGDRSEGRDTLTNIAWLEFSDQALLIGEVLDTHPDAAGPEVPIVAVGEIVSVRGEYPGDRDLVAIELQAGQLYRFSSMQGAPFRADDLVITSATGGPVELFGPSPTSNSRVDHQSVTFRAPQSGRYFVEFPSSFVFFTDLPEFGFTVSPDFRFQIEQFTDRPSATGGDDVILASAADVYVDGLVGQDTFVYNRFPDGLTPQATVWSLYQSSVTGTLPTVFLNVTMGLNAKGHQETVRHDIQITDVEKLIGSSVADFFYVLSEQGSRHTDLLTLEGRDGDDYFDNTLGPNRFDGGAGTDTVSYSTEIRETGVPGTGVQIDLIRGAGRNGAADGDEFFSIERVIGTDHADLLIGSGQTTFLAGAGGNDWLTAGPNGHEILGGMGADMVSFINLAEITGRPAIEFRLIITPFSARDYRTGGETYRLSEIENITGTVFSDLIEGNTNANLLRGSGGNDWFVASAGGDTIDGGTGADMISFVRWQSRAINVVNDPFGPLPPIGTEATGVVVALANGARNTHLAAGLELIGVERVTGSSRQDVFYGDGRENDFRGLGDYDWFVSSDGGRERYFGGGGIDTVTYFNAPGAITASLRNGATVNGQETGYGSQGWASRDLYFDIENLVGSGFGDNLTGNNGRNQINGLGGDDIIFGHGGIDYLKGSAGNDTIDGGSSSDYAILDGNRGAYTIIRTSLREIRVAGPDGTDSLTDVEYLIFDDAQVTIWELPL